MNKNRSFLYNVADNIFKAGWYITNKPKESRDYIADKLTSRGGIITASALSGALIAGSISHNIEERREYNIPLAFSEVSNISRMMGKEGFENSPLTRYYAKTNDLCMKIFESWNNSTLGLGNPSENFAQDLMERAEGGKGFTFYLDRLLREIPQDALALRKDLLPYLEAIRILEPANNHLKRTWDYTSTDVYKTSTCTRTVTYSCGSIDNPRTCSKPENYPCQEYDHTIHNYDFNLREGVSAATYLQNLLNPEITIPISDKIIVSDKLGDENIEAINSSRRNNNEYDPMTVNHLDIANTWARGATYNVTFPEILRLWSQLPENADRFRDSLKTSESTTYSTFSRTDSGPEEFRLTNDVLRDTLELNRSLQETLASVQKTPENIEILKEQLEVLYDFHSGIYSVDMTIDDAARDVLRSAQRIYDTNFKQGFDVAGYRNYMPPLFATLGALLFGGTGFGVGKGIDKLKKRKNNKKQLNNN